MVTCKDIKEFCIAFWHNGVAKFGGSVGLFLTLFSLYVEPKIQRRIAWSAAAASFVVGMFSMWLAEHREVARLKAEAAIPEGMMPLIEAKIASITLPIERAILRDLAILGERENAYNLSHPYDASANTRYIMDRIVNSGLIEFDDRQANFWIKPGYRQAVKQYFKENPVIMPSAAAGKPVHQTPA